MARIGVLCLPLPSHLTLFIALSRALSERSHRIVFFGIPEIEEKIRAHELDFQVLAPAAATTKSIGSVVRQMANLDGGFEALRLQQRFDHLRSEAILSQGPKLLKAAALDLLIVDQAEPSGGSVADLLRVPWVTVCSGLCLNAEPRVPPFFTTWSCADTAGARARNRLAYTVSGLITRPQKARINGYRRSWNLPPLQGFDDTFSPYAQISQQIAKFDFPRDRLPACFHYVGPIRLAGQPQIPFDWDRLGNRSFIYASLGTLVNQQKSMYHEIAKVCHALGLQLVLSLGGGGEPEEYRALAGTPMVVKYAPQRELLKHAALTITHGGLNTTLESLSEGVPLVAIPIAFEQPAIAARIRWTKTGDFVTRRQLRRGKLGPVLQHVLQDPSIRQNALQMQETLSRTQGAATAGDIIDELLRTGKPVPRTALRNARLHRTAGA